MNTEGRASNYSMTDEQLEVFQRQVTEKYGISILGHPDRLRWFLGDFARGIGVRSTTTEGRGPEGVEPGRDSDAPKTDCAPNTASPKEEGSKTPTAGGA